MKIVRFLFIVALVGLLGWGLRNLAAERHALQGELRELNGKLNRLETENQKLIADIEYFKNPDNLVKELKSKFNYREEDERLIIVVPSAGTSSDSY